MNCLLRFTFTSYTLHLMNAERICQKDIPSQYRGQIHLMAQTSRCHNFISGQTHSWLPTQWF